jgi:hypothetical protein
MASDKHNEVFRSSAANGVSKLIYADDAREDIVVERRPTPDTVEVWRELDKWRRRGVIETRNHIKQMGGKVDATTQNHRRIARRAQSHDFGYCRLRR